MHLILMILAAAADDEPVFAMYVSGTVEDFASIAGVDERTYIARMLDDLRDMGVNTVHPNNLDFDNLPLWLELARERGLRVIAQGGGGPAFRDYYIWNPADHEHFGYTSLRDARDAFRETMLPQYRDLADRYADDPVLQAFCLTEEIAIDEDWIFDDLREVVDQHRRLDGAHPAYVEYHWADMAIRGLESTGASIVAYGAGTTDDGPWHEYIDWFEVWMEQVGAAAQARGAEFWAVLDSTIQYRQQGDEWVPREHIPSPTELSLQVWLAYANGAHGVNFWWYHDYAEPQEDGEMIRYLGPRDLEGNRTPVWDAIRHAADRMERLAPWLGRLRMVEGNGGLPYARESRWIRARLLEDPETGERYLLVVNKNCDEALSLDLDLPGRATLLPGGREVDPRTLVLPAGEGALLSLR